MVVKLSVQQIKYFAGARLLVFTKWGSCKPIIVTQFAFAGCCPRLHGDCQFGTSFIGGDKPGIQCSIGISYNTFARDVAGL